MTITKNLIHCLSCSKIWQQLCYRSFISSFLLDVSSACFSFIHFENCIFKVGLWKKCHLPFDCQAVIYFMLLHFRLQQIVSHCIMYSRLTWHNMTLFNLQANKTVLSCLLKTMDPNGHTINKNQGGFVFKWDNLLLKDVCSWMACKF